MNRALAAALCGVLVLAAAGVASALPIVGASANTIPGGSFMIDVWGTWQDFTMSWQEEQDGDSVWVGFRDDTQWTAGSFVPRVYYGVTDWLTVRASLPLEDRYRQYEFEESAKSATGLGDIVVDPKIQLFRAESGFPRLAALAGVRFPTGDSEGDGSLPLSDGTTDYMLGGVLTHHDGALTGHACVTYWFNGKTDSGFNVKDLLVVLGSVESDIDESWTLLWEFKGVFGETPSEFHRTYVCPGIMWNGEHLNVGLSALVSMSAEGDVGTSTINYDWAPYFRAYYRFF